MPYIYVKAFPKDDETKRRVAKRINEVFLEEWGCPPQAITVGFEEVSPKDWEEKVLKPEIEPKKKNMMILDGEEL